jgi:hypothetical protein
MTKSKTTTQQWIHQTLQYTLSDDDAQRLEDEIENSPQLQAELPNTIARMTFRSR